MTWGSSVAPSEGASALGERVSPQRRLLRTRRKACYNNAKVSGTGGKAYTILPTPEQERDALSSTGVRERQRSM